MTFEQHGAPLARAGTAGDLPHESGTVAAAFLCIRVGAYVPPRRLRRFAGPRTARRFLLPVLLGAALAGCATTPPASTASVVVDPSRRLEIYEVTASSLGASILVRGRVKRRSVNPSPIWGHLHVEAWGGGVKLAQKDTRWQMLGRHRLPGSAFRAKLEVEPRLVEEIRVSHAGNH